MDKRCRPAAAVLAICAVALTASPVAAQDRCSPVVEAQLTKFGIEPSRRTWFTPTREDPAMTRR